jgi:uncharacterized lipoprotein YddW (UPF0748 family)
MRSWTPLRAVIGVALVIASAAAPARAAEPRRIPAVVPETILTPTPPPLTREFRAAWITPVEGGEWPSAPGLPVEVQKAELRRLLDRARDVGLNAVLLHVRVAADAFYPTARAPWSRYLLGRNQATPGAEYDDYDPVALAVREAHARGLQLHVWFNPFRASTPDDLGAPGKSHVSRTHPEWVRRYGKWQWIDPGIPAARRAVLDAIMEVVDRYDVDGVHLDDYFYPYLEERTITRVVRRGRKRHRITRRVTLAFPDDPSWKRYGAKSGMSRANWRRANIDNFVRTLYTEVKAHKPTVLVGISPFGIWRPNAPAGITGLDAYAENFADARRWLREGWVDYLAPQLYWKLDNAQQRFTRLDSWWREENVHRRHLWPGLFTMRVGSRNDPWPREEIANEITALRGARDGSEETLGHIHFRLRTLLSRTDDGFSLGEDLRGGSYVEAALPPSSPWLGASVPAAPQVESALESSVVLAGDSPSDVEAPFLPEVVARGLLNVATRDSVAVRWWVVQTMDSTGHWSARMWPATMRQLPLMPVEGAPPLYVAVTAVSAAGVASAPTVLSVAGAR